MDNLRIFNQAWSIRPGVLQGIVERVDCLRGIHLQPGGVLSVPSDVQQTVTTELSQNPSAFFSFFSPSKSKPEDLLTVKDGVAILKVEGVLEKTSGWDPGMDVIGDAFDLAMKDKKVKAIVLDIDSPGGTVDGTQELSSKIRAARGQKPIIAYANGLMASAAYWIGSAADMIVASKTATVGSIGVAMLHRDFSKRLEEMGIKETPIYAGKFKRIASREKPLSEEAHDYLQEIVDDIYALFIDAVAENRGVTRERAIAMADGKEFIGEKAREVGLVDFVGSMADAVAKGKERSNFFMDVTQLKEQHPDLYSQVFNAGRDAGLKEGEKAGIDIGLAEGIEKGVAQERSRVVSLLNAKAEPGATIKAIEDGASEADAYKAFFEAEKTRKASGLSALAAEAPKPVGHAEPEGAAGATGSGTFEAMVEQLVADGMKKSEAITKVAREHPKLHEAYLARVNKGKE